MTKEEWNPAATRLWPGDCLERGLKTRDLFMYNNGEACPIWGALRAIRKSILGEISEGEMELAATNVDVFFASLPYREEDAALASAAILALYLERGRLTIPPDPVKLSQYSVTATWCILSSQLIHVLEGKTPYTQWHRAYDLIPRMCAVYSRNERVESAWCVRRRIWLTKCWNFAGERSYFMIPEGKIPCPEDARIDFGLGARK